MDTIHNTSEYVKTEFSLAIKNLTTGTGTIQQRLKDANQHLHKLGRDNDFADDLKPEWASIQEQLKSVDTLIDVDAGKLAERIHDFKEKL